MRLSDIVQALEEGMTRGVQEEHALTPVELLGTFEWFETYVPKNMGAQRRKVVKQAAAAASKALIKLGFRRESERLVVLPRNKARLDVNPIEGGRSGGEAHKKTHYIKAVFYDSVPQLTEIILHEWAHNHFARLPRYLKESWRRLWQSKVVPSAHSQAQIDRVKKILGSHRFEDELGAGFSEKFVTYGIQHHKPLKGSSDSDLAFLTAFWPYRSGVEVKLRKPLGKYKAGDTLYLEQGRILTDSNLSRSVLSATDFLVIDDPKNDLPKLAQLIDVNDMRKRVEQWPKGKMILALEKRYLEEMRGYSHDNSDASVGASVLSVDHADHQALVRFVKGCIERTFNYAFHEAGLQTPPYTETEKIAEKHAEELTKTWTEYLLKERAKKNEKGGMDSMQSLAHFLLQSLDSEIVELASGHGATPGAESTLQRPEGGPMRQAARSAGVTASAYGAANPDELWSTTIEALAAGRPVPKYLAQAVRDLAQGKAPTA